MTYVRRNYKDTVFRHLFGSPDRKAEALELYNALAGTSHDDPDAVQITTIENFIFLGHANDVSFLIGDQMVLWEHQSTNNPNMPLRGLQYFSQLYSKYIAENRIDQHGTVLAPLPTPRFFVFYFGTAHQPDRRIMQLSDAFLSGPGDLEVTATVLNCNEGRNQAIMGACKTLRDYAHLLALVRRNQQEGGMGLQEAVNEAIDQCIADGCLAEYLSTHKAEVQRMLFTMEDEERALKVHEEAVAKAAREKGLEEGRKLGLEMGLEEGRAAGRAEALAAAIESLMASAGCSADKAMDMLGIPSDERADLGAALARRQN